MGAAGGERTGHQESSGEDVAALAHSQRGEPHLLLKSIVSTHPLQPSNFASGYLSRNICTCPNKSMCNNSHCSITENSIHSRK